MAGSLIDLTKRQVLTMVTGHPPMLCMSLVSQMFTVGIKVEKRLLSKNMNVEGSVNFK